MIRDFGDLVTVSLVLLFLGGLVGYWLGFLIF